MKQINTLEERLDLKLLERSRRGVRLTEAGRSLYEDALRLFEFSRDAIARALRRAAALKITLRVGASMLNPCKAFINLWRKISGEVPHYALRIVPFEDNHDGILAEIGALGEKFDFLVAACGSGSWLSHCNFYRLGEYRVCSAVPRGHRLAGKKRLQVKHLHGQCLIMGARGDASSVDRVRDALEAQSQISIEDISHFYGIEVFNLCEREKNLLTLECWKEIHPSRITIPVPWEFTVPCGILYPLHPSESIVNFLNVLQKYMRQNFKKTAEPIC